MKYNKIVIWRTCVAVMNEKGFLLGTSLIPLKGDFKEIDINEAIEKIETCLNPRTLKRIIEIKESLIPQ